MNRVVALVGLVLAVVAVTFASHAPAAFHHGPYAFRGYYPGKCGNDGFYYRDHYSFVICSNGNSYVQPCAPGSRNSAYGRYSHGHTYHYRDFCDVNLVDYGAGARRPYYHRPAYGYGPGHGHGHFGFVPYYGRH